MYLVALAKPVSSGFASFVIGEGVLHNIEGGGYSFASSMQARLVWFAAFGVAIVN